MEAWNVIVERFIKVLRLRYFEADVEKANQKLKSAAVVITVAGVVMGLLLLSAWDQASAIKEGTQLRLIFKAARSYADNTGEGYPQRMSDLLRDGYLKPDVFGLTDDWQVEVEAARSSLPPGTRQEVIGEFRFTPLNEPTRLGVIIFGWVKHDESTYSLLYDDDHIMVIQGDPSAAFEMEAQERRERGLPLYEWDAIPLAP